jgi:hypothetical protein
VSATARRTKVFLTTLKYTPDARALARSCVIAATAMPRFSARTIACAPATCFATSATTVFAQIKTQVLPPSFLNCVHLPPPIPRRPKVSERFPR